MPSEFWLSVVTLWDTRLKRIALVILWQRNDIKGGDDEFRVERGSGKSWSDSGSILNLDKIVEGLNKKCESKVEVSISKALNRAAGRMDLWLTSVASWRIREAGFGIKVRFGTH